ncbi:SPRY domain-containing SOCS box protein 3-like isoform X1 [Nerophis ophidion]|uniref:SPRY domain-containing SOCS box protein 3-like isoform X1 n=2 Tax=Nerophis ophidion TaxID=159077 RepID=UPI002ADF11A2|nr:SPRY domain-containing SOCS box protein 3-like isoform X1 [Nerophis ophidion]
MSHCKTGDKKTSVRASMLRRGRSGRARHLAWTEMRRGTDSLAVMTTTCGGDDRESRTTTQSEVDQLTCSQTLPEAATAEQAAEVPPSLVPVVGESFCQCVQEEELNPGSGITTECLCGEEDHGFHWVWDGNVKSSGAFLSCDDRKVSFHSDYSCGTAAIRGTRELSDGQHFWEVKMTSPVYGTDMMVGVGTSEVNLEKFKYNFGSLLGHDEDSWGLSYTGLFQHKGDKTKFSSQFGQGSIIGMHLDTWHGTLTFYKNRRCIGVAATRLQKKKLYPMVCSTAAKSSMKVIRACYTPTSLQYLCCTRLRQMLPACPDIAAALELPPGMCTLLRSQLGWVFSISNTVTSTSCSSTEASEQHSDDTRPPPRARTSPLPDATLQPCPCSTSSCTCRCPPTPPSCDYDSCGSEPEDYQSKRCRWT